MSCELRAHRPGSCSSATYSCCRNGGMWSADASRSGECDLVAAEDLEIVEREGLSVGAFIKDRGGMMVMWTWRSPEGEE
jgi:hypothetical protein